MNTTNRPARELPWIVNQRHLVITAKDFHGVADFRKDQDAAYAVHACNAYPKLMDALWRAIAMLEFNGIKTDQYKAISELRRVLTDCEEG